MAEGGEELAKSLANLTSDIYKDSAQAGFQQIGVAFGAVAEWALQKTYPLRLNNERRRLEYERNVEMLRKSMASIPPENVIEVAPEMSVPLLEKLGYTSNEKLAELFVNLLNKASNSDTASEAHPAFISIIESLSVDEAKILQRLYGKAELLYVGIRIENDETGNYFDIHNHVTWIDSAAEFLDFPTNSKAYLAHFESLEGVGKLCLVCNLKPLQHDLTVS